MAPLLLSYSDLHPHPPHYLSAAFFLQHTDCCVQQANRWKFFGPNGTIPASQVVCSSLLEEYFDITQDIKAQDELKYVADSLEPIFDWLTEIGRELGGLALTHRWNLRETDLWSYMLRLQEIDKVRMDGKSGSGGTFRKVLLYTLWRCYVILYRLLLSSEPALEELMPTVNKLSMVKKCLDEVPNYGGSLSARNLYPLKEWLNEQEDGDDDYDEDDHGLLDDEDDREL
ncbi:hypothetical protein BDM02DRAFT_3272734 [Thelephora ganbajun]|uniref:Uncharacterized protein n=1 Tax=Thelephora ganbajun TaxID=370292 RepID=A0ACB6Z2L9_THEGA|nr:hypothetical protein BDM02DRAFT_3272734 [Thelephora ganbajun]